MYRCQENFVTAKDLIEHCNSDDHTNLNCKKCNAEYVDEEVFLEHVSTCSNKEQPTRKRSKKRSKPISKPKENRDEFSCNKCENYPTQKFKQMFDHFMNDHKHDTSCLMCDESFKTREAVLNHMKAHSDKTYCRTHFMAFDTTEELLDHLTIPNHNRACVSCDNTVYKNRRAYLLHRAKAHLGKEKVKCPHCPLYYENRQNVRRHVLRFHEKMKYMCEHCGNAYTTRTNLNLHVARQHEGVEPETFQPVCCEECGKMFSSQKTLFSHRFKKHWGHSCICRHCKQTFPDKDKLEEHVKETGHSLFECDVCQKTYINEVKYILHVQTHKDGREKYKNVGVRRRWWKFRKEGKAFTTNTQDPNERFECAICKSEFKNRHTMVQHKKIHFSEKPFKCEICGKCFRINRFLESHMNIHTGNRPHKCQYCGKGFMNDSSKYQHEMIHTGKRPHKCPACDKGFISSSAMKKHIQIHMKDSKSVAYLSEYLKAKRPKIATFSNEQEAFAATTSSLNADQEHPMDNQDISEMKANSEIAVNFIPKIDKIFE